MTWFTLPWTRTSTIAPSEAARALGAEKRRAERARRDETTALLIASNASGYSAGLGWR
jgi:hypothetical protein